jgi:DNA recombination protein RmuC
MVEIALGVCIVLAFVLGLLFGRSSGQSSAKAESTAQLETIEVLKSDKTRLDALSASQAGENQQLREKIARAEERQAAQEQKYTQMKADVDKAFAELASKALRDNNETFLTLARQKLGAQTKEAEQTLTQKEEAIRTLLDPLSKTLEGLDKQTREMELSRANAYGELKSLVDGFSKTIPESVNSLRNETSQLVSALRAPKTRGNWGELQLKRCVEYAGMVEYCSFAEQTATRSEDDRLLRPDMTIRLPNGRIIIVDAKTPLDAFLDAGGGSDPSTQSLRFAAHAERVKSHLRELSGKSYWRQFEHSPEFVVCFLPSEALFSAALEADPSLIEFGSQANVVMATPTTLIALLKAVAFGWQQSQVTQNAKAIQEAGRDLYNKLVNAHEYFSKLGAALENAVAHYNRFVGAVEGRGGAFFHARKLGNLVHGNDEIDQLESLPAEPRLLAAEDWEPELALTANADDPGKSEI